VPSSRAGALRRRLSPVGTAMGWFGSKPRVAALEIAPTAFQRTVSNLTGERRSGFDAVATLTIAVIVSSSP